MISYQVIEAQGQKEVSVSIQVAIDHNFEKVVYKSGVITNLSTQYPLDFDLAPRTRYYVHIFVVSDLNELGEATTWFETGKMSELWTALWVGPALDGPKVPNIHKNLTIVGEVESIRAYISCAGLYSITLNGRKAGEEYLTPYCNDYSTWMQVISHDLTNCFNQGENHLELTLSNGWYKGSFTFGRVENIYGSRLAVLAEIHVNYKDGRHQIVSTDNDWSISDSIYDSAEIYDGVLMNTRKIVDQISSPEVLNLGYQKLTDRLSLPVKVMDELSVCRIFKTSKGETCLDFGQNMVGWVSVNTESFPSKDFSLQFFEELDPEGNVYIDNLRSAKASFVYLSDGRTRKVEPEFTYYGFRYVQLTGLDEVSIDAFTGRVIYSEMKQRGMVETSNALVNKLFQNALWGQKGNFVDVPTDCPQRDERLGWTGDAQVFCGTALYNMDSTAFYEKYLYDLRNEQRKLAGGVPVVVPTFATGHPTNEMLKASVAGWGDAATVIPWSNYLHTGDKNLLARHYPMMKSWVDFIRNHASDNDLWDKDFQLGDWLALDNPDHKSMFGMTPSSLVASAYYLYSTELTQQAAEELGYVEDVSELRSLAARISTSIKEEFITKNGRVASDTQTADVLALQMGFAYDPSRTIKSLSSKIRANKGHLNTGFVGTAYLCQVLSNFGENDMAYKLLLNKEYPGWLYEVEKGATTIWERWNSIQVDGKLFDAGMNSFNHYAYGSVIEWVYRNAAGIQPTIKGAGFRIIRYAPQPNPRLEWLKSSYDSECGIYRSEWSIHSDCLQFTLEIPFNGSAELKLPNVPKMIQLNDNPFVYEEGMTLGAGHYKIVYTPTQSYYPVYNLQSSFETVLDHPKLFASIASMIPEILSVSPLLLQNFPGNVVDLLQASNIQIKQETVTEINDLWSKIRSWDR